MNDSIIGQIYFKDQEQVLYSTTFKSSLLKNGLNKFKVKSINTEALINKFYFDWFELNYRAELNRKKNNVYFKIDQDKQAKISLWGLTANTVSIYNLTRDYYIPNYQLKNEQRYIIKLVSAGFEDGNISQIKINYDYVINGGHRGHNIAVFDTSTGKLEDTKWFDTLEKSENSDSMAAYISSIPEGKIVLVSIRDEGS